MLWSPHPLGNHMGGTAKQNVETTMSMEVHQNHSPKQACKVQGPIEGGTVALKTY